MSLQSLFFLVLAAFIGFGIGDTLFFKSMTLIGVSKSYTIVYTHPLFTMIVATVFMGEPFLLQYAIGAVVIFLSVIIISLSGGNAIAQESLKGWTAAFGTAILWTIGIIFVSLGSKNVTVAFANAIRFFILFPFLAVLSRPWRNKHVLAKDNLVLLALSGILGMALGGVTFIHSIQLIGISRATSFSSSSPVLASAMSIFFLKEKVTWKIILASLLVVMGTYFLT